MARCHRSGCLPSSSSASHEPTRHVLATVFGAGGLLTAGLALRDAAACDEVPFCVEHTVLAASGLLSCWCFGAAMLALNSRHRAAQRPRRARGIASALLLLRALLCGLIVAFLGWLAAHGTRYFLLMAIMQASATVGAWGACATQFDVNVVRAKSPPPSTAVDPESGGACATDVDPAAAAAHPPSVSSKRSLTLPRGWRYHKSSGMFEHKRSGRMQWEPPSTAETGSPLHADLEAVGEERGAWDSPDRGGVAGQLERRRNGDGGHHHCSDSDSASDGGSRERSRRARGATWAYNTRPRAMTPQPAHCSGRGPMSVWELRDALSDKGGGGAPEVAVGDSPRRPLGGMGRSRPGCGPSYPDDGYGRGGQLAYHDYHHEPPVRKGRSC